MFAQIDGNSIVSRAKQIRRLNLDGKDIRLFNIHKQRSREQLGEISIKYNTTFFHVANKLFHSWLLPTAECSKITK